MTKFHVVCMYCGDIRIMSTNSPHLEIDDCYKCGETSNFKATKLVNYYEGSEDKERSE